MAAVRVLDPAAWKNTGCVCMCVHTLKGKRGRQDCGVPVPPWGASTLSLLSLGAHGPTGEVENQQQKPLGALEGARLPAQADGAHGPTPHPLPMGSCRLP